MKVIDHAPSWWFLFEEDGNLFLDGNYSHSAFGYDWMIQLTPDERKRYEQRGHDFIESLARDVQDSCPLANPKSAYVSRRVPADYSQRATSAVQEWNSASRT